MKITGLFFLTIDVEVYSLNTYSLFKDVGYSGAQKVSLFHFVF